MLLWNFKNELFVVVAEGIIVSPHPFICATFMLNPNARLIYKSIVTLAGQNSAFHYFCLLLLLLYEYKIHTCQAICQLYIQ